MNDAMRKWISGHRLFFLVIQASVMCLDDLRQDMDGVRRERDRKTLVNLARLMHLSAGAMRYTGDFSVETYRNLIRPSMPDSFSGLDNVDHASLMKCLSAIRPGAEHLEREFPSEYASYKSSIRQAYDAHIWVCERFVSDASSLRTQASELPASQVLEKFRDKRLALLDTRKGD
jgi:hypothetical protein